MGCERFIGLVRVSTPGQGKSKLGLESGLAELHRYVESVGGELVQVLEEVDSGSISTLSERPTLQKAITLCLRRKCCLLVPRVDRLGRSMAVLTDIKRSGVAIRIADQPNAPEEIIDILMALSASTARKISETTRNAARAYKDGKRVSKANTIRLTAIYGSVEAAPQWEIDAVAGKQGAALLGCRLTPEARSNGGAKAAAKSVDRALAVYADLIPEMKAWKDSGLSLQAIADRLNERGERTRNDAMWSTVQVLRTLRRAEKVKPRP